MCLLIFLNHNPFIENHRFTKKVKTSERRHPQAKREDVIFHCVSTMVGRTHWLDHCYHGNLRLLIDNWHNLKADSLLKYFYSFGQAATRRIMYDKMWMIMYTYKLLCSDSKQTAQSDFLSKQSENLFLNLPLRVFFLYRTECKCSLLFTYILYCIMHYISVLVAPPRNYRWSLAGVIFKLCMDPVRIKSVRWSAKVWGGIKKEKEWRSFIFCLSTWCECLCLGVYMAAIIKKKEMRADPL